MLITKLTGGLGNQMFQYAAGLAKSIERKETLKLDLSNYKNDEKRVFSLFPFNISIKKANFFEIFFVGIFSPSLYLDDYFQSEKYFEGIKNIIKREFQLIIPLEKKYPDLVKEIKNSNSVSIHVRRTDYIDKQHMYIIPKPEYYKRAMSLIEQKIPNPTCFFFSDDIEWVKKNISCPKNSIFVSGNNYPDYEELFMMSLCKHNIITNSTFSWWGAWLNSNPNKIVITPQKWFNEQQTDMKDLNLETWIKI